LKKRIYKSLEIFVFDLNAEDVVRTSKPIGSGSFEPKGEYPTEWW